jgi:hypothetical protein
MKTQDEIGERFEYLFSAEGTRFIECGSGWNDIIYNTLEQIEKLDVTKELRIFVIKEKYGSLRIQIWKYSDSDPTINLYIDDIIHSAEKESINTCENCGSKENIITRKGYIQHICKSCNEKLYEGKN